MEILALLNGVPVEEKAKLAELRRDARPAAQSFARNIIRNLMRFHEISKEQGLKLQSWTYTWF
jgi:hypothetical protein